MLNNQVVSTDQKGGSICFILQDEWTKGYRHGIIHWNNVFVSDIEKIDGIHKEINDIRIISHEWENIRYWIKSPREISIKSFDVSNNKNTDIDIIKIRNYQLKTTETNWRLEIDLIGSLRWLSMAMNKDNIVVMFVEDELQNNIAERNSLMAVAKNDELHLPNNISWSTLHPLLKNEQIKALIENFRA